ncbi:thermonuclease family protein [Rhizobium sp. RHZ01]|uniref:thermonuclease family protein n=1 Tax=Rhizobium sp. RHZ01 TaxID=2769304 RepID=UPI001AEF03CA|nr:thermonuclease family protein [Rhizobium sp. RHZ01]
MGLLRMLVRLFAGRGRPQLPRETTEPFPPLILREQVASRAIGINPAQLLQMETILRGRYWVIDGDTIVINNIRMRLAGIDAPELDHPWGQRSKWALIQLCKGRTVTARIKPELSHDRMVAECFLPDGRDLGAELVRSGLALDWPKFPAASIGT